MSSTTEIKTSTIKQEALRLIDQLPDYASWADIEYQIYVRRAVEEGLEDLREGRTFTHEEIRREFGLEPR